MDVATVDANILLSMINMKLRDYYSNLDNLCDDMNIDRKVLEQKLNSIGYSYIDTQNQFK